MSFILEIVLGVGFLVLLMAAMRRLGQRSRTAADRSAQRDILYDRLVRAHVRRRTGLRYFAPLRNGLGGIYLTVTTRFIRIAPGGVAPFTHLAKMLGVDYVFLPSEVNMRDAQFGVLGSRLFARRFVVIRGVQAGRADKRIAEVALAPVDRDLDRLKDALSEAGVCVFDSRAS